MTNACVGASFTGGTEVSTCSGAAVAGGTCVGASLGSTTGVFADAGGRTGAQAASRVRVKINRNACFVNICEFSLSFDDIVNEEKRQIVPGSLLVIKWVGKYTGT